MSTNNNSQNASGLTPVASSFSRRLPVATLNIVAKNAKVVYKETPPPPITAPTQPMPVQPANQEPQSDATNPESSIVLKRARARSVAASAVIAQKDAVLTNSAAETANPPAKKRGRPFKNQPPLPVIPANPAPETAPEPLLPTTEPSMVPKQPVFRVQPPLPTRMQTRSLSKAAWLSSQLAATGDAVPAERSEIMHPTRTQNPVQNHPDAANDPSSSATTGDVPASVDQMVLPEKMPTIVSANPSPMTEPVPAPPVNPPSSTPQQPVLAPSVAAPRLSPSSTELATSGNPSELSQHQPPPLNAEPFVEPKAAYDVVPKLAPSVHPKSGYDPHIIGGLAESCWNAVLEAVEKEELEGVPVKPNYPCVMPWQRDPADPTFGLTPENIAARNKMKLPLPRQPGDTFPRSYLSPDGLGIISEEQYTRVVFLHNLAVDMGVTPRSASEPRQKAPAKKKPVPTGSKTPKKKPVPAAKTPSRDHLGSSSSSMPRLTAMSTKTSHSGASKANTNPAPGSKTPVRCHPAVINPVRRNQQNTASTTHPPAPLIRIPDRPTQGIVMVSDNNNDNQLLHPPAEILESRHAAVSQQNARPTRPSNPPSNQHSSHSSRHARNPVQVGVPKRIQRDDSLSTDSLD